MFSSLASLSFSCFLSSFLLLSRLLSLCVMRTVFYLVWMLAIDLIALNNYSRITLYFLMSFGSSVVSDFLFDLLADVSHSGLVLSVHIFRFSMSAKSSRSLLSIVSSLCALPSLLCATALLRKPTHLLGISSLSAAAAQVFLSLRWRLPPSSPDASSQVCPQQMLLLPSLSSRVAAQVFWLHRLLLPPSSSCAAVRSISDSSCAAATCLPVNLFSNSPYLRIDCLLVFSDESGSSARFHCC